MINFNFVTFLLGGCLAAQIVLITWMLSLSRFYILNFIVLLTIISLVVLLQIIIDDVHGNIIKMCPVHTISNVDGDIADVVLVDSQVVDLNARYKRDFENGDLLVFQKENEDRLNGWFTMKTEYKLVLPKVTND